MKKVIIKIYPECEKCLKRGLHSSQQFCGFCGGKLRKRRLPKSSNCF